MSIFEIETRSKEDIPFNREPTPKPFADKEEHPVAQDTNERREKDTHVDLNPPSREKHNKSPSSKRTEKVNRAALTPRGSKKEQTSQPAQVQ
jgi:hypothetical protein